MANYAKFGILSLLTGSVLAIPAPQDDGWQGGEWLPANWQHRTVGTPLSRGPLSTSSAASTVQPFSKQISTTSGGTSMSITQLISPSSTRTMPASSTSISRSTQFHTITTSTSISSSTSIRVKSSSTITSSASSTGSVSTAGRGKRGMAYNDASYATLFDSTEEVTWGYNWYSASNGLPSSYNFAPMLWGASNDFTDVWPANVANSLGTGTTHLLAFNEPDLASQSNMTPAVAAQAYMTYMQPYSGQAKLCSPAITNGNSATMGFNWLSSFMAECSECTIDCVAVHWYNIPNTVDDFKSHITTAYQTFGKPIWITEFGLVNDATNDEVSSFLEEVLPWLDEQVFVERYAYFMVAENYLVDDSGTALSGYGNTFAKYSN